MSEPNNPFPDMPSPPETPRALPPPGWFADPSDRHGHRYWDGSAWTEHVADDGVAGVDPLVAPAPVAAATVMPAGVLPSGVAPPPSVPVAWSSVVPPVGRVRSLAGLTKALTVVLWCVVAIAVAGVIAYANRASVIDDMLDAETFGDFARLSQRADDADSFVGIVGVLVLATTIAILVLLIIWMWRVAKNAELLGRTNPRFGPGWTIGGWFIPLANAVIPVLVVQDLWRGSDPQCPPGEPAWRARPRSGLVGAWWGFYLATFALRLVAGAGDDEATTRNEIEMLRDQDRLAIVGMTTSIVAAILLIQVVRRLARRQMTLLGTTPPPASA